MSCAKTVKAIEICLECGLEWAQETVYYVGAPKERGNFGEGHLPAHCDV